MIILARYVFYLTVLLGAGLYIFTLVRSRPPVDETLFEDAEIYCLDQKWDEARVALIDVLRENPLHPGAHFYLGRAYMFGTEFRPIMAEGEFLTALNLFRKQDRKSGIDRFKPKYFEMMCYIEAAKSNLVQIDLYLRSGAPLNSVQNLVADAAFYAERAERINPQAAEVRDLMAILDALRPRFRDLIPPRREEAVLTPEIDV